MVGDAQSNDRTRATPSLSQSDITLGSRDTSASGELAIVRRGAQSTQFQPGDIIDTRYQVVSVIGSGGFGCVYKVHQLLLRKDFALKTLNPVNMSEVTMLRLRKEAQAASRLEHPNLVQAVDFGMIELVQPYLVMDLVEGPTLAQYLKEHGRLSVDQALEIFIPLAQAVAYAHRQGVVHRDLKPSNVILSPDRSKNAEFIPKIFDFGIAKIRFADESAMSLTGTGEIFGTPLYMSPEQCAGKGVDARSDIYSFGCMLFEALTGAPPFNGHNPLEVMIQHGAGKLPSLKEASLGENFAPELERIVSSMLAKSPDERYSNAQKVADDLFWLQHGDFDRISTIAQTGAVVLHQQERKQNALHTVFVGISCTIIGAAIAYLVAMETRPPQTEVGHSLTEIAASSGMGGDAEDVYLSSDPAQPGERVFKFDSVYKGASGKASPVGANSTALAGSTSVSPLNKRPGFKNVAEWLDKEDHVLGWGSFLWWNGKQPEKVGARTEPQLLSIPTDGSACKVPQAAKLILKVGYQLVQYTYTFGRFRPNDLYGIVLTKNACSFNDATLNQVFCSMLFQDQLRILTMDTLTITQKSMRSIGSMGSLRWLDMSHIWMQVPKGQPAPHYNGSEVAEFLSLPKLRVLRLELCENVTPVLAKLAKSNDLRWLSLANDNCSDQDLKLIGQLQQLEILDLRGSALNGNNVLDAVSHLKHLKKLLVDLTVLEKMDKAPFSELKKHVEVIPVHGKKQTPSDEIMENVGRCITEVEKPSQDLMNCLINDPGQVGL